jgi:parvulin-like peptidyl-prolyl isomerase
MRSILAALVWVGLGAAQAAEEAPLDTAALAGQVVARVGDREISALAFRRELEFLWHLSQASGQQAPEVDRDFRAAALSNLVDRVLLRLAAENAGIRVAPEEVDREYVKRRRSFVTEAAHQAFLDRLAYSEAEVRADLETNLLAERYVDKKCADLKVDSQEVIRTYQEMRQGRQLLRPGRTADLRHLLIRARDSEPESWAAAEERVRAARARIVGGESFASVATELTEDAVSMENGGLYHEALPGMVLPEFEAYLFTLPPGEVSEPFKSRFGWHILTIERVNEPGVVPFNKVRDDIERSLLAPLRAERVKELLEQARTLYRVELVEAAS